VTLRTSEVFIGGLRNTEAESPVSILASTVLKVGARDIDSLLIC